MITECDRKIREGRWKMKHTEDGRKKFMEYMGSMW